MTFLTLDDKTECVGFYSNGELVFGQIPEQNLDKTWKYSSACSENTMYANIFCNGKDINEICPESLQEQWTRLNNLSKSYIRSFIESKVSLRENCFYDLVPKKFLIDLCEIKCQIIDHVFSTYEKPIDYEFKSSLSKLLYNISFQNLSFDEEFIKNNLHDQKIKEFQQKYLVKDNFIIYNQFSSKTGRLTTEEKSFPILNISKNLRSLIKPDNDFFLDIDYNAAEVRVFLALNGFKQPVMDIHEWNRDKFGYADRDTAKNDFISWLYGKKNDRERDFKKYYNTDFLKKKYWNGSTITSYYGRKIESDEFHCINYTVQSTTADMVLRQVLKVSELLKGCQSKIKMIIHDNIVIDVKKEEKELVKKIVDTYNETEFGKFKSSVKIGKSLGDMRKVL